MRKNRRLKNKKDSLFFYVVFSLIVSSLLVGISMFLKFKILNNKGKSKIFENSEVIKGLENRKASVEHFNKTSLNNYFNNLEEKYSFLSENFSIESCEKLNTTKERILCKEYYKSKQREISMFQPYLIFALVEHGVISAEEAVKKYNIPKIKLAEALGNSSYCFNDSGCLKNFEKFKKSYKNVGVIRNSIDKAWYYYKKGLLNLKNFENPYNKSEVFNKTCNSLSSTCSIN